MDKWETMIHTTWCVFRNWDFFLILSHTKPSAAGVVSHTSWMTELQLFHVCWVDSGLFGDINFWKSWFDSPPRPQTLFQTRSDTETFLPLVSSCFLNKAWNCSRFFFILLKAAARVHVNKDFCHTNKYYWTYGKKTGKYSFILTTRVLNLNPWTLGGSFLSHFI